MTNQPQLFTKETTPEERHIQAYTILHEYFFEKFNRIMLKEEFDDAITVFENFNKKLNPESKSELPY